MVDISLVKCKMSNEVFLFFIKTWTNAYNPDDLSKQIIWFTRQNSKSTACIPSFPGLIAKY